MIDLIILPMKITKKTKPLIVFVIKSRFSSTWLSLIILFLPKIPIPMQIGFSKSWSFGRFAFNSNFLKNELIYRLGVFDSL